MKRRLLLIILFLILLILLTNIISAEKFISDSYTITSNNIENVLLNISNDYSFLRYFTKNFTQDEDVTLLWNASINGTYKIDSSYVNMDDYPDILVGTEPLDGITGNDIYQFQKGFYIGCGDVINDDDVEIFTSYYDEDYNDYLCCVDIIDGTIIWEYTLETNVICSISVGNIYDESDNEVIVGVRNDVICLEGKNGSLLWRKHLVDDPYTDVLCTEISDVNNDGYNEVIACTSNNEPGVFCLNGENGEIIWSYIRAWIGGSGFRSLCIDNLNNDPYKEIILEGNPENWYNGLMCLSGVNGEILWTWNEEPRRGSFQSILSADFIPEIPGNEIIASGVGGMYCLYGDDNAPSAGRVIWHAGGYDTNNIIRSIIMSTAIGDLDGDGLLDVIGHTCGSYGGVGSGLYAINGQYGSPIWNYGNIATNSQDFVLCIDLNNDYTDEVVSVNTFFDEKVRYDVAAFKSHFPQENNFPDIPSLSGKLQVNLNEVCEYSAIADDIDVDALYYYFNWGDGTGNVSTKCNSGESVTVSHSWKTEGTYYLKVKAIDEHGLDSDYSDILPIIVIENSKPNNPIIDGPTSGKIDYSYVYTISSTDEDNDPLYYYIDWGDGTGNISKRCQSGASKMVSHKWYEEGMFIIKVRAIDEHGAESDWTTLQVIMPKNKIIHEVFHQGSKFYICLNFLNRIENLFKNNFLEKRNTLSNHIMINDINII